MRQRSNTQILGATFVFRNGQGKDVYESLPEGVTLFLEHPDILLSATLLEEKGGMTLPVVRMYTGIDHITEEDESLTHCAEAIHDRLISLCLEQYALRYLMKPGLTYIGVEEWHSRSDHDSI